MIQHISINISEKHNCFVWLPTRTASNHAVHLLNHFEFYNIKCDFYRNIIKEKKDFLIHQHQFSLFDGHEKYKLISTIRNPYSRSVSLYEFLNSGGERGFDSFDNFVLNYKKNPVKPIFGERVPDFFLRQENLYDDYIKIPFVRDSKLNECGILKELCEKKINKSPNRKPIKDHYNQETADIIYSNYKEYFELCGYDKDSWKYM
jgi:hypothetical protein